MDQLLGATVLCLVNLGSHLFGTNDSLRKCSIYISSHNMPDKVGIFHPPHVKVDI